MRTQPNGRKLLVASGGFQSWRFPATLDAGDGLQTAAAPDGRLCAARLGGLDGVADLPVPDHTTLSNGGGERWMSLWTIQHEQMQPYGYRRWILRTGLKFFGAGEWARAKHGETRRSWRKLHISVDPASSEIADA